MDTAAVMDLLDSQGDYWRPITSAVRAGLVGLTIVPQGAAFKDTEKKLPTIWYFGDDTFVSLGPKGFNPKTLARAVLKAKFCALVTSAPQIAAYQSVAGFCIISRFDSILIESRPEHEADWHDEIKRLNSNMAWIICTVRPEGTA